MNRYIATIGTSSFRKLVINNGLTIDTNKLFVDKILFIKDFLDNNAKVLLTTRPRSWGKSSILSMLQHFFCKEVQRLPTAALFENLQIAKYLTDQNYKKYQGTHTLILVSFEDIKGDTFQYIATKIKDVLSVMYRQYGYILQALNSMDPIFKYELENLYKADIADLERIFNKKQDNGSLVITKLIF